MLTFLTSQLSARMIICNVNKSKQINCYWSAGDCSMGKPPGADYCFNVDPWTNQISQGRALVFVDDQSNGAVQIGDKIVNILPDFLDSLFRTNKLDEINNIQPTKISTKVSKKRFEEIAKELGIKVTKVKKLPKANYCPACEEAEKNKNEQLAKINPFESVIIEMVCDCNPNQVLSTFVTDANGGVNITVPKDANYSFKLVMPPVLKENSIKMADLANDVVVNFKGAKNAENLFFNNKGVASAKNLQQGNYEMALSRKPPKGPKESSGPPRGKCPPGETPWLGGCIPVIVVNGSNKVKCPVGTVMTQFGCMDIKNPGNEPVPPRPDGFPSPKNAVDINCPSGKYDANGNCISYEPRRQIINFGMLSFDLGYLISSNSKNENESKALFAGNGIDARVNYRYGKKIGIIGTLGYLSGSTDVTEINIFSKKLEENGFRIVTTGIQKRYTQFLIAVGPSILLGPKRKLEFYTKGGINYQATSSSLKIDLYDANVFVKNLYTAKINSLLPFWEAGGTYKVGNIKRTGVSFFGKYGSNGITVGVNIALQDCRGAPCFKCHNPGCCPDWCPKSETIALDGN